MLNNKIVTELFSIHTYNSSSPDSPDLAVVKAVQKAGNYYPHIRESIPVYESVIYKPQEFNPKV